MKNVKNYTLQIICYTVLFFFLYILSCTEILPLRIANASPLPILSAVIAVAFMYGSWQGFWAGIICGIALDCVAANGSCFNTLSLLIIGAATGYVTARYLNKNIYTLSVLALLGSAAYFSVKWFVFYFLSNSADSLQYLLFYALPSGVYTALFIFPVYGLGLLINKIEYK